MPSQREAVENEMKSWLLAFMLMSAFVRVFRIPSPMSSDNMNNFSFLCFSFKIFREKPKSLHYTRILSLRPLRGSFSASRYRSSFPHISTHILFIHDVGGSGLTQNVS